jgi:hypothetical protein
MVRTRSVTLIRLNEYGWFLAKTGKKIQQFVILKWPMKILHIFSPSLLIVQEVKPKTDGFRPKNDKG